MSVRLQLPVTGILFDGEICSETRGKSQVAREESTLILVFVMAHKSKTLQDSCCLGGHDLMRQLQTTQNEHRNVAFSAPAVHMVMYDLQL